MRFAILGPLQVHADGRELDLGGTKTRSLLAVLLINANQVISAERLIDLLWGDQAPITADKALQVYVSQLRKAIDTGGRPEDRMIRTRPPGYVIRVEPEDLDLLRFENLVATGRRALVASDPMRASATLSQALHLWRGPALSDFVYEPFAQTEIARLQELRVAVLEDRIEADLALGRHAELVPELEATIAEHPLRERLRAQLMLALYRSGRQVDALEAYTQTRSMLADELGLEPGPQLQALHRQILEHDPNLAPPAAGAAALAGSSPTATLLFGDLRNGAAESPDAATWLERHHKLIRDAVDAHGGRVFELGNSALRAAFRNARDALSAAVDALGALSSVEGLALPRLALHTGDVIERGGDLIGAGLARCVRLLALGHAGQVLLSSSTVESLPTGASEDFWLKDLGEHRLPDLSRRERVFQLVHPDLPSGFPALRSLESAPNNLPLQLTSFVGRAREMEDVMKLLWANRLVTLTGAGGCGKTRLALQVAAELVPEYGDGVWMVELSQISDPDLVASTVSATLGVAEQPGRPALDVLLDHALERSMLVVLDNCEHLIDACAHVGAALLAASPNCRLLATSRALLEVPGEAFYRVPSLSVPEPDESIRAEELAGYESVRLLVDRVSAVLPDFRLEPGTADGIVQICRRLDGLPLAIELAAARARSLPLEQIAGRLDDRFRLLSGRRRALLPRHQTLRAVMDWSYDLLPRRERSLLARLWAFVGGFTLEAVEEVCSGNGVPREEVLDALSRLVDNSLVMVESSGRYRLMETVREYCRERLAEAGEVDALRRRHASFFLRLAEEAETELIGPQLSSSADRLEIEHDNLRAAVVSLEQSGRSEDQLALVAALWRYCYLRGHYAEGREWLGRALAGGTSVSKALLAKAFYGSGCLAFFECDYAEAEKHCATALRIYRELEDKRGAGSTLNRLGAIARERADYRSALELHARALITFRQLGDLWEVANALQMSGFAAWLSGDFDHAAELSGESLALCRQLDDKERTAWALLDLGAVAHYQRDESAARRRLSEALALFREVDFKEGIAWSLNLMGLVGLAAGDTEQAHRSLVGALELHVELGDRWRAASVLEAVAAVLAASGRHDHACESLARAYAVRAEIGAPVPPVERAAHDRALAEIRSALGFDRFEAAWARGLRLTLDAAREHAAVVPDAESPSD